MYFHTFILLLINSFFIEFILASQHVARTQQPLCGCYKLALSTSYHKRERYINFCSIMRRNTPSGQKYLTRSIS